MQKEKTISNYLLISTGCSLYICVHSSYAEVMQLVPNSTSTPLQGGNALREHPATLRDEPKTHTRGRRDNIYILCCTVLIKHDNNTLSALWRRCNTVFTFLPHLHPKAGLPRALLILAQRMSRVNHARHPGISWGEDMEMYKKRWGRRRPEVSKTKRRKTNNTEEASRPCFIASGDFTSESFHAPGAWVSACCSVK